MSGPGSSARPTPASVTPAAEGPPSKAPKAAPRPLSLAESFMCGGLAGCTAVTISNVPETLKTRLQLQGELQRTTPDAARVYRGLTDVFVKTWKNEGVRGLQRGLMPAYGYQILLNGSRLGFYEPLRKVFNGLFGLRPEEQRLLTSVTAGAVTGMIGAGLGSPLFLVKARIQAYSPALPVGAQHYYRNSLDALRTIMKSDGVLGLWRGVNAAFLRTAMGSSVQLPSYNYAKGVLAAQGWSPDGFGTFLTASAVSGVCVCAAMQPADTVLTRTYNQNTIKDPVTGRVKGVLYKGPLDCLWKTFKAEGIAGWYKGTTAHFFRIFPHTVVTLVANELIMAQYRKLTGE